MEYAVLIQFSMAFQPTKPISEYVRYAQLMEKYDFDAFLVYDDLDYKPCWPILFAVAPHTKRLLMGPCVTHPWHIHSVVTAGHIASLDELTNGRAILGIGRGSNYEHIGVKTPRPLTTIREAIEIISRTIRGDKTEYHGKVFNVSEAMSSTLSTIRLSCEPRRETIPIFIGTWGPKLCQVAGEMKEVSEVRADMLWNPNYISVISRNIALGAAKVGRDPSDVRIAIGPQTSVSKNRDAARNYVKRTLADYLAYAPYHVMASSIGVDRNELETVTKAIYPIGSAYNPANDYTVAVNAISDYTIDNMTASGTPEDIIRGAKRMIRSGVSHISFCHPHGPNVEEAIHLLGREVIPFLQEPSRNQI
jgi:5,10-methylenetetrahydromethanopterin reductase